MSGKVDEIVSIADAVAILRSQIYEAKQRAKNTNEDTKNIQFNLREVEVELQLVMQRSAGGAAGAQVEFGVFSANLGGGIDVSRTKTHTIRFTLEVLDKNSTNRQVEVKRSLP